MATRLYFPNIGAAPITPAFGTYTETTGADRLSGGFKTGTGAGSKTQAHTATAANSTFLTRQYICGPLEAQTLAAGTVKGTIRVLESAINDNLDAMRLSVRVVSGDGNTYRSPNLFAQTNSTVAEFATVLTAKRLATGEATSSVTASDGDYLVIEIATTNTTVGTSLSDTVRFGALSDLDLAENETDTATNNPWIELSINVVWKRYVKSPAILQARPRAAVR